LFSDSAVIFPLDSRPLLVRSDLLLADEELLKSRIVSNWVPDRIDLQALDGRVKTSRDREQSLQRLGGFVRLTSACLYFGIGGEKKCP